MQNTQDKGRGNRAEAEERRGKNRADSAEQTMQRKERDGISREDQDRGSKEGEQRHGRGRAEAVQR
jgi:hypothetical protein